MRVLLVGSGSFIARHVVSQARIRGIEMMSVGHNAPLSEVVDGVDAVINLAIDPAFFSEPYAENLDWDLRIARLAISAKARFVMCSSRRVYPASVRFGAREIDDATGDETTYGRNKAASEKAVMQLCAENGTVLRFSNIFGSEYGIAMRRPTFFSRMLSELRRNGVVRFDMGAGTRRDFLPVEHCARAMVDSLQLRLGGVYNIGCGFPVPCGEIAEWLIAGYGRGRILTETGEPRDEFFLDTRKWSDRVSPLVDADALRSYCLALGEKLRDE